MHDNGVIKFVQPANPFQIFGLRQGSRKSIKYEPVGTIGLANAFLDHAQHNVIRDELAAFHQRLGLTPKFGVALNMVAQHVTC